MKNRNDSVENGMIEHAILAAALVAVLIANTGCMQILGAQDIDAWGLRVKGTTGFEVKAGVQQYDQVQDNRGIGNKYNTVLQKRNQ